VSTAKTQLERNFDPDAIRHLKASAAKDLTVGGPNLATHAFRAGLVDECQLLICPVFLGAGKSSLPLDRHRSGDEIGSFDHGALFGVARSVWCTST
jgi:riboflavin biosynthesis pyrimidine reductase